MKPEDDVERAVDIRRSLIGKEAYALRSRTIELTFADAKEKRACNILIIYQGRNQAPNWARLILSAMNLK